MKELPAIVARTEVGKKITFDNVLLYVDGDNVEVGSALLRKC